MNKPQSNCFSEAIFTFREKHLPKELHRLAGYSALTAAEVKEIEKFYRGVSVK